MLGPNISSGADEKKGSRDSGWENFAGAFYSSGAEVAGDSNQIATMQDMGFLFKASRSSSVYGAASSVQPASYATQYLIKY